MNNINVAIYVRVSTEDQKEYGYSIPQQIDILTKLATNNNWNIYKIYNDAGISGSNTENRPMLKELIDDIKNNKINKVLITKLDRLSRNVVDTETILNIFNSFNCELIDSSGKVIESNNPSGWLFTIIQSVFGQYERKAIISRVKDGFAGKVKQGKSLCSSTPPYGYDREKGSSLLTVNDYEASIVRRIYAMYLEGDTFTEISEILNAEKILTKLYGRIFRMKNIDGKTIERKIVSKWSPKTIRLILSNPTYIGKVRYHINGIDYQEFDGLHKPIITIDSYNSVQDKIKKINSISKTNRPREEAYYCGRLICDICGKKMTTKWTVKKKKSGDKITYLGYRCINREKKECTSKGISHKKVEQLFLKYLNEISGLEYIEDFTYEVDIENDVEEIENIKKNSILIKAKKKEIMNLFLDNKIHHEQMQYMIKELNEKEETLKKRLEKLQIDLSKISNFTLKDISGNMNVHWQYLTNSERYKFINQFIDYILVSNDVKPQITEIKFY